MFLSCHVLLPFSSPFFTFLLVFWDWRLTRGPTIYRLTLNFFLEQGHGVEGPKIGFTDTRCIVHRN